MEYVQGLLCIGFFLVATCYFAAVVVPDLFRGYAPILRRFRKNPRFGLLTLLEMFLGAAVFFAMSQSVEGVAVLRYLLALLATAFVVGMIHLVFGDAFELFTRPGKPKEPGSDDPWEEHEKQRIEFGAEEGKDEDSHGS